MLFVLQLELKQLYIKINKKSRDKAMNLTKKISSSYGRYAFLIGSILLFLYSLLILFFTNLIGMIKLLYFKTLGYSGLVHLVGYTIIPLSMILLILGAY